MSKEFKEPAFPVPGLQHDEDFNGMTLRDYFAAKAMQGLMSRDWSGTKQDEVAQVWVRSAYAIADLMLSERAK